LATHLYEKEGVRLEIESEHQLKIAMLQKGYKLEAAEELLKWYTKGASQIHE